MQLEIDLQEPLLLKARVVFLSQCINLGMDGEVEETGGKAKENVNGHKG